MKRLFALALVAAATAANPAQAGPLGVDILTNGSNGFALVNPQFTIGYAFDTTAPLTISALGVWDEAANGLVEAHDVGLWTSGGTLLASTTVTPGSPIVIASASGLGNWVFEPLAGPLSLAAGSYVIGSVSGNDEFRTYQGSIALDPAITNFDSGKFNSGGFLAFPGSDEPSDLSLFGPNLLIGTAAVPEPASLALLVTAGAAALGYGRRRSPAAFA